MKVNRIINNDIYNRNFNGNFKSPLDIKNTYGILKSTIWYRSETAFPEKYGEDASLLLNLIKNMTGIEYLNLTKKQKNILDKVIPDEITRDANRNYELACLLRTYLKEHFGNFRDYTIISIGRSLATCFETLRHMGADTKFLPLSGLREGEHNIYKITPRGVSAYGKYLASIGLSKEQIRNNPAHKYILMDYTSTGTSLKNAYEFLTLDELLSNAPNIETLSTEKSFDWIHNGILSGQLLKRYSKVAQLNLGELENVFQAADPYKYDYRNFKNSSAHIRTKLFRLKMFELLDMNNELKSL